MKRKIHRIDEEIIESVSKQSRAGQRGRAQLEESRESIKEVFGKIGEIKTKASNSEQMVNDICSDIRDLDFAKRNLSLTTKALSNLQSIVQELERLKTMTERKNYSEVANLTEAVKEILRLFAGWSQIDRVKELQGAFDSVKRLIKQQVFLDLGHIDVNKYSREELDNLADACFVIDAMGEDVRNEFLQQWSERQLGVYELKFKPGAEESQLPNVDKRYQWLLTWISHYEEHFAKVFPMRWRASEVVAHEFCLKTSERMLDMLEKTKSTLKVNALKAALKNTLKFEDALVKYFSRQLQDIPTEDIEKTLNINPDDPNASTSIPMSSHDPMAEAIVDKLAPKRGLADRHEELIKQEMQKFRGVISMSFEGYMYLYVENQQAIVQNRFVELLQQETWTVDEQAQSKVFASARGLFDTLSKVRQRVQNLNQSQAFFEIFGIFQRYLSEYADKLKQKLDQVELASQRGTTVADEITCCVMINTAQYCASMVETIQKIVQQEISEKFKTNVDLEKERVKFTLIIAQAREVLTKLIALAIDPAFIEMMRTQWDRFTAETSVLDASSYVSVCSDYFYEHMPMFRNYIMDTNVFRTDTSEVGPNYFQIICDSILSYVPKRFEQALFACRKLNEAATQQLVTDFAQFRKMLEMLPTMVRNDANGDSSSASGSAGISSSGASSLSSSQKVSGSSVPVASQAYLKRVRRETEPVEKKLKVIWTPADMLVDTFKALLPNSPDTEFVAIMQLKGIPFAEQHALLDAFGTAKDSRSRELVTRDWVNSSKNALDSTTQTVKDALSRLNFLGHN